MKPTELIIVFFIALGAQLAFETFYLGNSITVANAISKAVVLVVLLGTYHVTRRFFTTKE